ncbi:MAG: ComEA family DNA-binding protein [Gemmatimonas sp.]
MPTVAERNALLFLAAVALIGGGARVVGTSRFTREIEGAEHLPGGRSGGSIGARALASQIAAVDSARQARNNRPARATSPRRSRREPDSSSEADLPKILNRTVSPRPPLLVDVNRATQADLERLPRVGPALASRIISWREQHGPYRSLEDLRHVRGIGPATVALLAPAVTF